MPNGDRERLGVRIPFCGVSKGARLPAALHVAAKDQLWRAAVERAGHSDRGFPHFTVIHPERIAVFIER